MKFVKWDKEFIAKLATSPKAKEYSFLFRGLRLFDGFYVGFIIGRYHWGFKKGHE
jgi:hypothetical protein